MSGGRAGARRREDAADDLAVDWEQVLHLLLVRSGNRCEARTPDCLGGRSGKGLTRGHIGGLTRMQVNIHHRRPRGMGGTGRVDAHSLANLMLVCGQGNVSGCHGHLERHRAVALARGYLLPKEGPGSDPATAPVILPSGRRVLLDDVAPGYLDYGDSFPAGIPSWGDAA